MKSPDILNTSFSDMKIVFDSQRTFFDAGHTRSYKFRLHALKSLRTAVRTYQEDLMEAMALDYRKPKTEAFLGDIGVVLEELNYTIRHLKYWMQDKKVSTPITLMPGSSKIIYEPKGVVMIFSPWNYPFNLMMTPLIGAITAGNCVVIKPAHETPHTALVIQKLISDTFPSHHIAVAMGDGRIIGPMLLDNFVFNHIFFTGSAKTGKWIMAKAAEHLTPVTLELGGKCPAIVDDSARINSIVKRIVWSKLFNAGQTCLAIDYLLVHEKVKEKLVAKIISLIKAWYGTDIATSPDYCRIVNKERAAKIISLMEGEKIIFGGNYNLEDRFIEPTLIEVNNLDSPIMKEEIFGPLLPIMTWSNKEDIVRIVRKNRYPLACYVFSENEEMINYVHNNIEFGGGCVNDGIIHFANNHFGFGGVMSSGMGRYHGQSSFETFSHAKPILKSMSMVDTHIWYPPYTDGKLNLMKKVMG